MVLVSLVVGTGPTRSSLSLVLGELRLLPVGKDVRKAVGDLVREVGGSLLQK